MFFIKKIFNTFIEELKLIESPNRSREPNIIYITSVIFVTMMACGLTAGFGVLHFCVEKQPYYIKPEIKPIE